MTHHALSSHPLAFPRGEPASAAGQLVHFALDRFLLLPLGAAIALVWANTASESYFTVAHAAAFVVNNVLMALFFGLLAQEIIEEVMPGGALHTWRRWSMPIAGAVGGTVVAPLVYLLYVGLKHETVLAPAWPVACAIDVVAAYFVLKTIRPRRGVLPFAMLMAVAADLVAILIIAQRQPIVEIQPAGTVLIVLAVAGAALLRRFRVGAFWPYLALCGPASWAGFYLNGLQPALALVPIVLFLPHEPRTLANFPDTRDDDPTHHVEHEWNEVVQAVLFLFGLVNAGVILRGYGTGTWALLTAALAGRPIGMLLGVGVAVLAGLHLPARVGWKDLVVVALATSSGFTLALFFAVGIVPPGPVLAEIKIGALSIVAGAALAIGAARLLGVGVFHRGRTHPA